MRNIREFFKEHESEFLQFARENPRPSRPDLTAFLLLDTLLPGTGDIVSAAEHQIWLAPDIDKVNEVATDEQLITLIRCGVFIDEDAFSMFV
jgi:hypothetical protein